MNVSYSKPAFILRSKLPGALKPIHLLKPKTSFKHGRIAGSEEAKGDLGRNCVFIINVHFNWYSGGWRTNVGYVSIP